MRRFAQVNIVGRGEDASGTTGEPIPGSYQSGRAPALARALVVTLGTALLATGCGDSGAPEPARPAATPKQATPKPPPALPQVAPEAAHTPTPEPVAPPAPGASAGADLVARGKKVYDETCIACHNVDPTQDGALGPAIAGSPPALVEARVVHASYPEGYTPKRDTKLMVALPHLEPDVPALAAYLAAAAKGSD